MEKIKGAIQEKCLQREKEISMLLDLIGTADEPSPNSIFIHGNSATGKTFVVKEILKNLKVPFSYVNCIECYTSKLLFETILTQVPNNGDNIKSCTTIMDMLRHLKMYLQGTNDKYFIVLDKAERLRSMSSHLLPAFLRLSDVTSLNISTIFISELIFEKFMTTSGLFNPYKVHFGDYSKESLRVLMSLDRPEGYTKEFYEQYCGFIIDLFYFVCKDLNELRYLAVTNFSKYIEPIESGEIPGTDFRRLWMTASPHLKKTLQKVYLREVASSQWENVEERFKKIGHVRADVELPLYSKYLLLAAYFASHNPAVTDKRFFVKRTSGKMTKKQKHSSKKAKDDMKKFIGPKPFPLNRLLAISRALAKCDVTSSAVYSQISTLVSLNLLSKVSADDQIDAPKYKCIVPLDFAVSIGNQVELDVYQYLYDYL